MHVVIAGAGIGGLCLAQGLVRAGIDVTVIEPDAGIVQSGYRLHMNADGGDALRECLSPQSFELYQRTSRVTPRHEQLTFIDQRAEQTATRPHIGPPNDPVTPNTAVNRRTLRQIMLHGVAGRVRFGQRVASFDQRSDGVTVTLESGETIDADVLVGADGVRSRVREQLLGDAEVVDTGLSSLYARTPLPKELAATLPEVLFDGFVFAIGDDGRFLTFGAWQPRQPVAAAVAQLAPGADIDPVDPYLQITLTIPPGGPMAYPGDVFAASSAALLAFWTAGVEGWDARLAALVYAIDADTVFATRFRGIRPRAEWAPSRVTVLGDAVHAMPPAFGAGANTALKDAATLARRLIDGTDVVSAIGAFEAEMRGYAYPILEMSLDPKAFDAD